MRAAIASLLLLLSGSAAGQVGHPSDSVTWIPRDGSAGWKTPITRETAADGGEPARLLAPNWYAKLPVKSIRLAAGGALDLATTRGKVLLLDFWASWCAPCVAELPHLQALHREKEADGLFAIAVNADEGADLATASAKKLGLTMTIGLNDSELDGRLKVGTLPTLILTDRDGRIRARWDGYKTGLEKVIAARVDKLLAGDTEGLMRPVAEFRSGTGALRGLWVRDLVGEADGVLALVESDPTASRVIASGGGTLLLLDTAGELQGRLKAPSWAGRLIDFGRDPSGKREVAGFRVGATSLGVIALPSGDARAIACDAPVADVAATNPGDPASRRLLVVTTRGASSAGAGSTEARPLDDGASIRAVEAVASKDLVTLRADGALGPVAGTEAWGRAGETDTLVAASDGGVAVGPRTVVASAVGRFLPGGGTQLAVATYAGHLALLDVKTGALLVDLVWPEIRDLDAADLDRDGRDELLVASGRTVTAVGAAAAR